MLCLLRLLTQFDVRTFPPPPILAGLGLLRVVLVDMPGRATALEIEPELVEVLHRHFVVIRSTEQWWIGPL